VSPDINLPAVLLTTNRAQSAHIDVRDCFVPGEDMTRGFYDSTYKYFYFVVVFQIHKICSHMNKTYNVTFRGRRDSALAMGSDVALAQGFRLSVFP
jgi:hypothetical protein